MTIKLYKQALGREVINFLQTCFPLLTKHSQERLLIICKDQSVIKGFIYNRSINQCMTTLNGKDALACQSDENSLDLLQLDMKEQQVISNLLKTIILEGNGYNLWKSIEAQLKDMPGWWRFFSTQRRLTLALKAVQKTFLPNKLKMEDDSLINSTLKTLKEKIEELLRHIRKLMLECKLLEQENRSLREELSDEKNCHELAIVESQQIIKGLRASQLTVAGKLSNLITHYETLCSQKNNSDERADAAENENATLRQQLAWLLTSAENKSTKLERQIETSRVSINNGSPQKALTAEAFNDQYQKYRRLSGKGNSKREHVFFKRSDNSEDSQTTDSGKLSYKH